MQWDDSPGAGFTAGRPWLRLAHDWTSCNVAAQECDPRSMLPLNRRLIRLRRQHVALTRGAYEPIAANFGPQPIVLPTTMARSSSSVLVSTHLDREGAFDTPLTLRANEALILA